MSRSMEELPTDILDTIFDSLTLKDKFSYMNISKYFRRRYRKKCKLNTISLLQFILKRDLSKLENLTSSITVYISAFAQKYILKLEKGYGYLMINMTATIFSSTSSSCIWGTVNFLTDYILQDVSKYSKIKELKRLSNYTISLTYCINNYVNEKNMEKINSLRYPKGFEANAIKMFLNPFA